MNTGDLTIQPREWVDLDAQVVAESSQNQAFVILNPVAGQSSPEQVRQILDSTLGAKGWQYTIYETTGKDDFAAQVRRAKQSGCKVVIAGGGDGTISAVAQHLVNTDIPLAILPLGTANVLSLELGVPQDLGQAVKLLVDEHEEFELDLMQIGNRYFILQVGVGIDAEMIKDTPREAKRRIGRLAYIITLLGKLFGYRSHRFILQVDGRKFRTRAWQVLLANAGTLGTPPFRWGPDIHPDDGELDLCIVKVRTLSDYPRLAWQLLAGHYQDSPNIAYVRVRNSATIGSRKPLPVQADGEIIGHTPIQIKVIRNGVRVIVPPRPERETASPVEIAEEADERRSGQ